jgi:hypothetical protein
MVDNNIMESSPCMEIVLHEELAAAALKRHEEYHLAAWYLLRATGKGRGHCRLGDFQAYLKQVGFRRTAIQEIPDRLLGSGLARRRTGKRGQVVLKPLNLQEMMARYDLPRLRWRVDMPVRALKGQGLRHRLFAYVEAGLGSAPKARATFQALTGVSAPTQIRGEQRVGANVRPNYARTEHHAQDRLLCVPEGKERHRSFRDAQSVYLQIPNSVSYPSIPRRKHVIRTPACSPRSEQRAPRPTVRRRYFSDVRTAAKQQIWRGQTEAGEIERPVLVEEDARALSWPGIGVYGLV